MSRPLNLQRLLVESEVWGSTADLAEEKIQQAIREAIERAEPIYTGGTRDMQERHYKKQGVADFKVNLLRELGLDDAQQGRNGDK